MNDKKHTDGSQLKRFAVKYIRDKAKSGYDKDDHCHICDTEEGQLDFHHFTGLADLWALYCRKNKIRSETVEEVMEHRDYFIAQYQDELYVQVVTLCKPHHQELHSFFGKAPAIGSAKAQAKWIEMKRKKWLEKASSKVE